MEETFTIRFISKIQQLGYVDVKHIDDFFDPETLTEKKKSPLWLNSLVRFGCIQGLPEPEIKLQYHSYKRYSLKIYNPVDEDVMNRIVDVMIRVVQRMKRRNEMVRFADVHFNLNKCCGGRTGYYAEFHVFLNC